MNSHYERILAKNRKIKGQNFNQAVSGARMDDAPAQADNVVATGAQYVTFLMGGNDVCTSSNTNLTPLDSFESNFRLAMNKLTTGLPNAKIYVLSVPDVYQLWRLFDGEWYPEWVWSTFDICQSMLDNGQTEADRQAVRAHNIAFNHPRARVRRVHPVQVGQLRRLQLPVQPVRRQRRGLLPPVDGRPEEHRAAELARRLLADHLIRP